MLVAIWRDPHSSVLRQCADRVVWCGWSEWLVLVGLMLCGLDWVGSVVALVLCDVVVCVCMVALSQFHERDETTCATCMMALSKQQYKCPSAVVCSVFALHPNTQSEKRLDISRSLEFLNWIKVMGAQGRIISS